MPLQADSTRPGLWSNPEWDPRHPGTFAVIIGVSQYEHLAGDDRSYGLGQLYVSALTAYTFFSWLKANYRHPDLPLAKVWLLLSPTDAESGLMADHPQTGFLRPTFSTCNDAIGEWFATMQGLDSTVCERSRAIFFFSGHGLEVTQDKQILLPSDYLKPPNRNVNMALSTYNLHYGLQALPMPEHFLFLDACRNDNEQLRELMLEGSPVLNPCPSWRAYPGIISSPIVYATGSGEAACEPMDPQQGISVFGKALVEGLVDVPGKAVKIGNQYWVNFLELGQYLRERVERLIEAAGARVKQHVRISGTAQQAQICEIRRPAPVRGPRDRGADSRSFGYIGPGMGGVAYRTRDANALPPAPAVEALGEIADPAAFDRLYDIVRNEFLTKLLSGSRVFDLGSPGKGWKPLKEAIGEGWSLKVDRTRRGDASTYLIDVQTRQPSSQWLEMTDDWKKKRAACVLIGDLYQRPHYMLRIEVVDTNQGTLIAGLDVALAGSNEGILGSAAEVWRKYRGVNIEKEASSAEFRLLEDALREKEQSPLAATLAALLLLRGRPALLHDWPRNLAAWFPERPDGCVIWVEQLLRREQDQGLREAIKWFLELERRGLPQAAEALGHAARQVRELLEFASPEPPERQRLMKLRERLERALTVFRPGGFCAAFIGPMDAVNPELIACP